MKNVWESLGQQARVGLVAGLVMIVMATGALSLWVLRTDYELLFGNLSGPDAAAMTAELDRMKVPYQLGSGGTSILVDKATVAATRLKLMGKDIPLHGAVGFELFNNTDFGMTEFAQKVNYQRALQGEITRTILSLAEVESARVHLALPDEGLFKRDQNRSKASITLALRNGRSLRRDQVAGIQRLIAAAVQGIASQDVTIVNQQGVALTPGDGAGADESAPASGLRLELKREVEQHLANKANAVLEKAFGAGQVLASVDVTLDMNMVRTTTEDVTAPPAPAGAGAAGVIVRERESTRDVAAVGNAADAKAMPAGDGYHEVDYQVGRRVEQVVSSPGSITRLQVLAILKARVSASQLEQVRALLGASVGASRDRGDTIVVQSVEGLAATVAGPDDMSLKAVAADPSQDRSGPAAGQAGLVAGDTVPPETSTPVGPRLGRQGPVIAGLVAAAVVLLGLLLWALRARGASAAARRLDPAERERMLEQVRGWLGEGAMPAVRKRAGLVA